MSKIEIARKIFKSNPNAAAGVIVSKIMEKADMTEAGARTYLFNLRHEPKTVTVARKSTAATPRKRAKPAKKSSEKKAA